MRDECFLKPFNLPELMASETSSMGRSSEHLDRRFASGKIGSEPAGGAYGAREYTFCVKSRGAGIYRE